MPAVNASDPNYHGRASASLDGNIIEAWGQGFLVSGVVVIILFTVSNMKRKVLLHKLILTELLLLVLHGTFIFFSDPTYGWYLSCTAVPLYTGWFLHNVIAWYKNRPFLPKLGSRIYITTVLLTAPFWICEAIFNFYWFNNLGFDAFHDTRPFETFFRDPWWLFTTFSLIWIIKRQYNVGVLELIRTSPRFGILLFAMFTAIAFALCDIIITFKGIGGVDGINPYWKLSAVFKCASDVLFLDDFKKVLDSLIQHTMKRDFSSGTTSLRHIDTAATYEGRTKTPSAPRMVFSRPMPNLQNVPAFGTGGNLSGNAGATLQTITTTKSDPQMSSIGSRPTLGKSLFKFKTHGGDVETPASLSDTTIVDNDSPRTSGTSKKTEPSRVDWFDVVGEDDLVAESGKKDIE